MCRAAQNALHCFVKVIVSRRSIIFWTVCSGPFFYPDSSSWLNRLSEFLILLSWKKFSNRILIIHSTCAKATWARMKLALQLIGLLLIFHLRVSTWQVDILAVKASNTGAAAHKSANRFISCSSSVFSECPRSRQRTHQPSKCRNQSVELLSSCLLSVLSCLAPPTMARMHWPGFNHKAKSVWHLQEHFLGEAEGWQIVVVNCELVRCRPLH